VFTEAIVKLPFFPPFWAILFFVMLLSLGIGSQIGMLEGMLCTIFDIEILKRISKQYITGNKAFSCILFYLLFKTMKVASFITYLFTYSKHCNFQI